MRARFFLVSGALTFAACVQLPSTGSSDAGAAGSTDAATPPQATGANCNQEPGTSVSLCQALSICPTLVVDTDQFPQCGFRVRGDTIDLECICNGESLCPMGAPSTCDEAQQLLSSQTELSVCDQVNEGRCTSAGGGAAGGTGGGGGSAGGGGSTGSGCDTTCESECGGNPSCLQECGC